MKDEIFFDTNIICYAYDSTEPSKRKICERLVEQVFNGEISGVISNQILVELFNSLTRKLDVPVQKANIIVKALISSEHWKKINYSDYTVNKALNNSERYDVPFLDVLIAETMKENGVSKIITENEKDFRKIPVITISNPFGPKTYP
jgi:predicted nucleic acid-binding protein